ncbi:50S ribosomal protein L6, partial [Escherichia coli]
MLRSLIREERMSRVAKAPVVIPTDVEVKLDGK